MRIVDPETGKRYVEKRRGRFNQPGQPRELTISCYRRYAGLRPVKLEMDEGVLTELARG